MTLLREHKKTADINNKVSASLMNGFDHGSFPPPKLIAPNLAVMQIAEIIAPRQSMFRSNALRRPDPLVLFAGESGVTLRIIVLR